MSAPPAGGFRGPLANSYPSAVALVIFALVPYLAVSTALLPLTKIVARDVGLSQQAFQLTSGMANAAYAFGTVAAVQLAVHLRGRRLLVLYAALFTIGSVLAATAWTPGLFIAGRVLQGLCTSLMLIAAVPALVIGWPAEKMRFTAAIMNLCIFGAVAVGPVIGGVQAAANGWRPLFWIMAGLGGLAFLFAILTFEHQDPQDRGAPRDWVAQLLAGGGCAAAFFGASQLQTHSMTSTIVLVPLLCGVAAIVVLVTHQYLVRNPLMPMRQLTSTFPLAGIIIAMTAGASSVAIVDLTLTAMQGKASPIHLGMLFWPEFGAAVATALVFGAFFRTRYVPVFPLVGMAMLTGGAAVLTGVTSGSDAIVLVGSGLVGLGVGASVSPALFTAGFSLRSLQLPRVFALVELLRGVTAFMAAPVIMHLAQTVGGGQQGGIRIAMWLCLGIAAGGGLVAAYLLALGRVRLQEPRLEAWLDGERSAIDSPPLLDGIRGDRAIPELGPGRA